VAPVLLLITFGIVDLGRVVYYVATLDQAANEGARTAVRGLPPDYAMPSDVDVQASVRAHAIDLSLANPCAKRSDTREPDSAAQPGLDLHHGSADPSGL